MTFSTLVFTGNLNDGERLNLTTIAPKIIGDFNNILSGYLALPVVYGIGQTPGTGSARFIGRPDLGGMVTLTAQDGLKSQVGLDVRVPMIDTPMGNAELYRFWDVGPVANIDARLGDSSFHVVGSGSATFSSSTSMNPDPVSGINQSVDRPLVIRTSVAITKEMDSSSYFGISFQTANGIGEGHSTLSAPALTTMTDKTDIDPMDFSSISLTGGITLAQKTKIYGSLTKGLKVLNAANSSNILNTNYDRINDGADEAVSAGLTQTF